MTTNERKEVTLDDYYRMFFCGRCGEEFPLIRERARHEESCTAGD